MGTMVGGILQIACAQYLKRHPELVIEDKPKDIKPETPMLFRLQPPGGAVVEVSLIKIAAINFIAKKVFIAFLTSSNIPI